MDNKGLTHFDGEGNAIMVDVSGKNVTSRTATAKGSIHVNREVMDAVVNHTAKKGDVLGVARVAGIMAVKQTSRTRPNAYGRRTKYNRQISLTRQRAFMLSHLTSKGEATESIKN